MSSNALNLFIAAAVGASVGWVIARGLPGGAAERLTAVETGQQEILKELQALRVAAPQAAVPAPAGPSPLAVPAQPLAIAGSASMGRLDAPLTMIEFSDFQCPFCSRHVRETFDQIKKSYVDTGKVRYVFRNFPIESLHPQAWAAARAGECANRQNKFWDMHARLFANQKQLGDADLQNYANAAGLNMTAFSQCVADPAVTAKITEDLNAGARAGVAGTPMFFVGKIENGKLKAMKRVNGADPFASFQQVFDSLLAGS